MRAILFLGLALLAGTAWSGDATKDEAPVQVMVLGTFHMANPGQDIHNVQAVDVLTPERQAELAQISDALTAFRPTMVAVEWPGDLVNERYAKYLQGTLEPSRNEVVQLGFRLAKQAGLERVHGIDVDGDFPYQALQQWAEANSRASELQAMNAAIAEHVSKVTELQQQGIAAALRYMNTPEEIAWGQGFYMDFLYFGAGDAQPGAELLRAWAGRNYWLCARLLQSVRPGDRVVVIYGAGHAYYLRRCAIDTPQIELVEANNFLPAS